MAIPSLLEETKNLEEAKCMRLGGTQHRRGQNQQQAGSFNRRQRDTQRRNPPECCLCKQAGREDTSDWLSSCRFFPEKEKKFFARTPQIMGLLQGEESDFDIDLELEKEPIDGESDENKHVPSIRRVMIKLPIF